jgi:hypothetical protein
MRSLVFLSLLFSILCPPVHGQAYLNKGGYTCAALQEQRTIIGIGLKAGDPIGLSMKGYFLKRFGLEVTGGYALGDRFSPYVLSTLDKEPTFTGFNYQTHEVNAAYAAQARLLMHFPLLANLPGLDWFVLAGYHYRYLDINYNYLFETTPGNPATTESRQTKYTIIDKGPEVGLGFEYVISGKLFSFFAEVSAMYKDNGITQKVAPLGGVGIRINLTNKAGKSKGSQKNMAKGRKKSSVNNTISDIASNQNGKRGLLTKAKKKTKRKTTVHKHKNRAVMGFDPDNF